MTRDKGETAPPATTLRLVGEILGQIRRNAHRMLPLMGVLWLLQFPTFVGEMDSLPFQALADMGLPHGPANTIVAIIAMLATHLGAAWSAVGWHRLSILNEAPGPILPRWHPGAVIAYFITAIVLAVVSWAPMLALGALIYTTLSVLGVPMAVAMALVSPLVLIGIWMNLRLSPAMIGVALRRPINVNAAYGITAPMSRPLWGLAILGVVQFALIFGGLMWLSTLLLDDDGYYYSHTAMYLDSAAMMLTVFLSFLTTISAYNVIYTRATTPAPDR